MCCVSRSESELVVASTRQMAAGMPSMKIAADSLWKLRAVRDSSTSGYTFSGRESLQTERRRTRHVNLGVVFSFRVITTFHQPL